MQVNSCHLEIDGMNRLVTNGHIDIRGPHPRSKNRTCHPGLIWGATLMDWKNQKYYPPGHDVPFKRRRQKNSHYVFSTARFCS